MKFIWVFSILHSAPLHLDQADHVVVLHLHGPRHQTQGQLSLDAVKSMISAHWMALMLWSVLIGRRLSYGQRSLDWVKSNELVYSHS